MKQKIQLAVTLQADWPDGNLTFQALREAAAAAVIQAFGFSGVYERAPHASLHTSLNLRFGVLGVSHEWVEQWTCRVCNEERPDSIRASEASYDDLADSGVPICPDCGDDMERCEEYAVKMPENGEESLQCPHCKRIDTLQGFDSLGADEGNVFCPICHEEFSMEEHKCEPE